MKTVYVIGAGASAELNLPFGGSFRENIRDAVSFEFHSKGNHLSGDIQLYESIHHFAQGEDSEYQFKEYIHAAAHIKNAVWQAPSIDHFLYSHYSMPGVVRVGKMAIVRCIAQAEQESELMPDTSAPPHDAPDLRSVENTWLHKFFELLTSGAKLDAFQRRLKNITLIVFNYDRCIEHYLFHATRNYFRIKGDAKVAEILSGLNIIHPYGQIGKLPWQSGDTKLTFGQADVRANLVELSNQIHTFSESLIEQDDSDKIAEILHESKRIVFLGFAYHQLNMDLLKLKKRKACKKIFGTAFDMSHPNIEAKKNAVVEQFQSDHRCTTVMVDFKCCEFMDQYSSHLEFA